MEIGDRRFDADVLRRSLLTLRGAELDELVADVYSQHGHVPRAEGEPDDLFRRRAMAPLYDQKGCPRGLVWGFELVEWVRERLGTVEEAA